MEYLNSTHYRSIIFFIGHKIFVKISEFQQKELKINNIIKINNVIFISYYYTDDIYKNNVYSYDDKKVSSKIFIDDIETFFNTITYNIL